MKEEVEELDELLVANDDWSRVGEFISDLKRSLFDDKGPPKLEIPVGDSDIVAVYNVDGPTKVDEFPRLADQCPSSPTR